MGADTIVEMDKLIFTAERFLVWKSKYINL